MSSGLELVSGHYKISKTEPGKCESEVLVIDINLSNLYISQISQVQTICGKSSGYIEVQGIKGVGEVQYNWKTDENLKLPHSSRIANLPEGVYKVYATDAAGCKDSATYIMGCSVGTIPQIVSPNGDGSNDKWVINYSSKYPKVQVHIYNRWGSLIYESPIPYDDSWDGTTSEYIQSLGHEGLPSGTYYYIIDKGNNENVESGYIELVK